MFDNEKLKWNKAISDNLFGGIQLIDLYNNGENYVLLNTSNEIHLWNMKGEYSSGFPIKIDVDLTNEVKFYRWKGKSYFIVANEENKVILFDGKGRELNIIKSKSTITKQIDVWASQNKLFAGFSNDSFFEMYNMDKNRSHREFALPVEMITTKIPNELVQFGVENGSLIKIDQKGLKYNFNESNKGKLIKVDNSTKNPTIIIQSANEIHMVNIDGIPFCQITLPFNEVDDVQVITSVSGKTTIAVIDGLENNVYFYQANGELLMKKSLEGQVKVLLKPRGSSLQVSTIIDQFIVQYFE